MVSLGTQPANRKSGFGHSSPTGARAQDLSRQPARPDLWGARVSNDPGLPDRMKAKRDHRVPLSGRALAILHDVQRLSNRTGLVFRSLRGKPLSNTTLSKLIKELGPTNVSTLDLNIRHRRMSVKDGLFVDLSTHIRGSWSSCNPMKIGVFLSAARSISRFCGGRLRGPRSWMGGLLGGVHA